MCACLVYTSRATQKKNIRRRREREIEKKERESEREREREEECGRSTFCRAEFQIRTPSINQERSVTGGYGKYALLLLHKFHQSCEPTYRRRWLSCRISLPVLYFHVWNKVSRNTSSDRWLADVTIGATSGWADIAMLINDFRKQ